jgi:exosortase H (IPTLxxWG-CTERM-specific)
MSLSQTRRGRFVPIARFVVVCSVSLAAFFLIGQLEFVQRSITAPYVGFVAGCSRFVLRLLGVEVGGPGTMITSSEFGVNIVDLCSGVGVTAIFFAAVLGFPATWKNRLAGLIVGYLVVFLINLTRIVALFLIGQNRPGQFDDAHYYYSQAFVMFASIGAWLFWVSLYSAYGTKSRHAVPR